MSEENVNKYVMETQRAKVLNQVKDGEITLEEAESILGMMVSSGRKR